MCSYSEAITIINIWASAIHLYYRLTMQRNFLVCLRRFGASASPELLGSGIFTIIGFIYLHWLLGSSISTASRRVYILYFLEKSSQNSSLGHQLLGIVPYRCSGTFGLYYRASVLIYTHEVQKKKKSFGRGASVVRSSSSAAHVMRRSSSFAHAFSCAPRHTW